MELSESGYVTEAVLQKYLADHPALLAGEQMTPESPRRWLLVSQEMGVPHGEESADRWSVDHLFLDQDAIPTLVETKRSTDSRIRREVIGQMLDYAANSVVYWPVEKLRNTFQISCEKRGVTTDNALIVFLGEETDIEEFWQRVETNLKKGQIRMVFVADMIPTELRRIVEFLNEQMNPAEVVAVEIKQFIGEGMTTLVPRVLGVTATTQTKQPSTSGKSWDEQRFVESYISLGRSECVSVLQTVIAWAAKRQLKPFWGSGHTRASFAPILVLNNRKYSCASLWSEGGVSINFLYIRATPGFETVESRLALAERFNMIPEVQLPTDELDGYAFFPMSKLVPPASLSLFLDTLDWFFAEVRKANTAAKSQPTT